MSGFQKLSHVLWYCRYHIVFTPKYRYQILKGKIGKFVYKSIYAQTERSGCQVVELNVRPDHVHLLVKIPPEVPFSTLMGNIKGKTAIQAFQKFPALRTKRYRGDHFWSAGYCVDTVGIDAEMTRKYVKCQGDK